MPNNKRSKIAYLNASIGIFFALASLTIQAKGTEKAELRVCADPHNLPFSNKAEAGFENKIAELLAEKMGAKLTYTWFPQRMGFIRNTLKHYQDKEGRFACDLVIGVPAQFDQASTTAPYYRSSYGIVINTQGALADIHSQSDLESLSSSIKSTLKVAAFSPSPAVDWLQRNQLSDQTEYFRVMNGDPNDYPGKLIKRVAEKEFDMLLIWGPIAGYFAKQHPQLKVINMRSNKREKFDFSLSMAVRYGESQWKSQIEQLLKENKQPIKDILQEYGVPTLPIKQLAFKDDD